MSQPSSHRNTVKHSSISEAIEQGGIEEDEGEEEEEKEEGRKEEECNNEEEEEDVEQSNETIERIQHATVDEKDNCCHISAEPIEDNKVGEKIKSVKSDLSLLIVSENRKKINESEVEVDADTKNKCDNEARDEENVPPELPPRPPPRPRQTCSCTCEVNEEVEERNERRVPRSCWASGLRKYVFLCTACGSLSILLGVLFLTVYFMLKSYTSSLNHFETIPTYVPSGMLIATGFLIICLACRKNRNSFLMKLCGLCSLCCAVLCVSVTVTTTVIHMNRLQTLRECLYTQKTQSCTCYSVLMDNERISDEGIKFVFNSTPDCEVIHGALYSCLRAIFGLSVIGILVCIFSCMLVYQLLSHEKKKMYWAQLEMRCRYLYRQQRNPHYYSCCDECRYPPHPHELFPWELMGNRFWSTNRIGNLYTPNPEDRGNQNRLRSGWNWRRLPWSRSGGGNSNEPTRANLGSPDSQYGFSSTPTVDGAPYTVLDPRTSGGMPACHTGIPATADITEGGFYSWGPPPPYASNRNSANNSPARRSLGDILHQVSPIRRNDNVSPARTMHHVHRHHIHHSRQCGSSSRQAVNNSFNQSDLLQKSTPMQITPITNAIQQQQAGMDALWSNSLSSVHRFQKVIQNKDNYENMYDSENLPPTSGFNTLPSLKKRSQTRVSDIFQNETSTAYFFSSAENLGCSTSNIGTDAQNKNLPPRVFLSSAQPNSSRYSPANSSTLNNSSSKSQNDLEVTLQQQPQLASIEGGSILPGNRSLRSTDRNTSLVRKLFVNCSPTKQKLRNTQEAQIFSVEKKESLSQTPRKKISKKIPPPKEPMLEASGENVITFHYRVGIPRSPNIQNFNQYAEKGLASYGSGNDGNETENWSKEKTTESEVPQIENKKFPKGMKYLTKDVDLLQKHSSLIKEFNKNIDLQNNLRHRNNKSKSNGIENEGFQNAEEPSREVNQHFPRTIHADLRNYPHGNQDLRSNKVSETEATEDYLVGNIKMNENESDVYFGDISNSSCYMSLQNDGPESLLYEDAVEERNMPHFNNSGHSFLNKQNLKMIEDENLGYNEILTEYEDHSEMKQQSDTCNRQRSLDPFHQNYRHCHNTSNNQFNEDKPEDFVSMRPTKQEPKPHESFIKNQRRSFISGSHYNEIIDNKTKYFSSIANRGLQDHYRTPDSITSNDEQSSSSLTADSGISSGRSFVPASYTEIDHRAKGNEGIRNIDGRSDSSFETHSDKFSSLANKIVPLDTLGDFSHPLFQKPKVLPRNNKYKEPESRLKKKIEVEESESKNEMNLNTLGKKKRSFANSPKIKSPEGNEEVSNQLLNTCNLTLTNDGDHFLGENSRTFESLSKSQENIISAHKDEGYRKSPKPLPRTSVLNKASEECLSSDLTFGKPLRFSHNKEKISHFLAPDAQYEFQDNYKSDSKPKTPSKHNNQNLGRIKPAIPARPLNLQTEHKKASKMENLNVQSVGPIPRRRKNGLEESDGKDDIEIETHSVNV